MHLNLIACLRLGVFHLHVCIQELSVLIFIYALFGSLYMPMHTLWYEAFEQRTTRNVELMIKLVSYIVLFVSLLRVHSVYPSSLTVTVSIEFPVCETFLKDRG